MKKKISVSVGIPACNEENNIEKLLLSVISQEEKNYYIKEIIIISDGSTDHTIKYASNVKDKRIKIFKYKKRRGKPNRLNKLFKIFKGDILIQIDADIKLNDKYVFFELIKPFLYDNSLCIVFGRHKALPPITFVENAAYFGFQMWEIAKESINRTTSPYYCTGQVRAFSKKFLKNFKLPNNIGSSEDKYSYYFAVKNNYKTLYAPNAIIYIRLASTFKDYIKQMERFLLIPELMEKSFGKELIKENETITEKIKFKSLAFQIIKSPIHITVLYLIIHSIAKIRKYFHKEVPLWEITKSSKIVNT